MSTKRTIKFANAIVSIFKDFFPFIDEMCVNNLIRNATLCQSESKLLYFGIFRYDAQIRVLQCLYTSY